MALDAKEQENFEYWLGCGTAEALSPKYRTLYLDELKSKYFEQAYEANSLSIENNNLKLKIEQLEKELEEQKSLNCSLTEELNDACKED